MVLASKHFPEEYGIRKKSLGPKCKIYSKALELFSLDGDDFNQDVKEFHQGSDGDKGSSDEWGVTDEDFFWAGKGRTGTYDGAGDSQLCLCQLWGWCIFLQSGEATSMYVRKVSKIKGDECWNKPARIVELISTLYSSTPSKLHFGFLKEYGNSFYWIITANVSVNKDNSVFLAALNDLENNTMDNDVITRDILPVFMLGR